MRRTLRVAIVIAVIWSVAAEHARAQAPESVPPGLNTESRVSTLSLDEAKQRALHNSKVLNLAMLNVQSKEFATKVTRADYFPKIIGSSIFMHFDRPLGTVLTTRGGLSVPVNVVLQNQSLNTLSVAQPITALLKVKAGVQVGHADEAIAQAQTEQARRAILVGTEQLYWGLLSARQIKAGASTAVQGAQMAARSRQPDAMIAVVEARQGEGAAAAQVAEVEDQLWMLLDVPPGSQFELVEPSLPPIAINTAEEAGALAVMSSPELREAAQNASKAEAAIAATKVDFYPNVNVIGGYANQYGVPIIQQNVGYLGVQGSYTFFEWGKRRNAMNEVETTLSMAQLKWRQTQDEIRQKGMKAFRDYQQSRGNLEMAREMARLRAEAAKRPADPATMVAAVKAQMLADVEVVKANLTFHIAAAELANMTSCHSVPVCAAGAPVRR